MKRGVAGDAGARELAHNCGLLFQTNVYGPTLATAAAADLFREIIRKTQASKFDPAGSLVVVVFGRF